MIHTRICDLLGVRHPIVLGGMGTATTAPLVAAVSNAGAFGTLGTSAFNAATLESEIAAIHGLSEGNVGARLTRLRQKLTTDLEDLTHELR